jgi:protein SCO1/2
MSVGRVLLLLAAMGLAGCAPAADPLAPVADETDEVRTPPILQRFDIGGDFALTAHDGTVFDLADHRGEVFLMFFGYTHGPDFCPATLSLLAQYLGTSACRRSA